MQAPKRTPISFAHEAYHAVNALKFIEKDGKDAFFRYWMVYVAGVEMIDKDALDEQGLDMLYDERSKSLPAE